MWEGFEGQSVVLRVFLGGRAKHEVVIGGVGILTVGAKKRGVMCMAESV